MSLKSFTLSDIVRAAAGSVEAQHDVMLAVVTDAYYQAIKHGNKNQLQGRANSLYEQAQMYSQQANCKDVFAKPKTAATYYAAHLSALTIVGVPSKAESEDHNHDAEVLAQNYVAAVNSYIVEQAGIDAKKRAASKLVRESKARNDAVDVAGDAKVDAHNAAAVSGVVVTDTGLSLDEMAAIVANALRTGTLSDAAIAVLAEASEAYNDAQRTAETAALLAKATAGEGVPA